MLSTKLSTLRSTFFVHFIVHFMYHNIATVECSRGHCPSENAWIVDIDKNKKNHKHYKTLQKSIKY